MDSIQPQQHHLRDIRPGMKNLSLVLIVLETSKASLTKDGHEVRTLKVADKSGSFNLSLWDKLGVLVGAGDVVRLGKAYCSLFKQVPTLYIGKGGELIKVGDFCLQFAELPNYSEKVGGTSSVGAAAAAAGAGVEEQQQKQ